MEQPSGYEHGDPSKKVWKLKRALYGLVEAPRLWYETLNKTILDFGFVRTSVDPCLYVIRCESHIVIMGVFVDDFLLFGTQSSIVDEVKIMLVNRFKTKTLGLARWVLGMRLQQTESAYILDQTQYSRDVLARFR